MTPTIKRLFWEELTPALRHEFRKMLFACGDRDMLTYKYNVYQLEDNKAFGYIHGYRAIEEKIRLKAAALLNMQPINELEYE
jgi:hypothetical protein